MSARCQLPTPNSQLPTPNSQKIQPIRIIWELEIGSWEFGVVGFGLEKCFVFRACSGVIVLAHSPEGQRAASIIRP